jgi:spiro-SPASM protein
MNTAALIYAGSIADFALRPFAGGASSYERALAFAAGLPELSATLVLEGEAALPAGDPPRVRRQDWTVDGLLEEAERFVADHAEGPRGPIDALVFMYADEPFLDPGLAARILADYRRYRADYAFADGYPKGLAIEALHPRILPSLRALASRQPMRLERGWLFQLIQKDINSFDIETVISPRDLREFRLELCCDTRRNTLLTEQLQAAGVRDADTALSVIPGRLDLLRTLPAFIQVQVTGGCPQSCSLCPWPLVGGDILSRKDFLPRARFASLAAAIKDFCGDAVLDISLWGEPSLHPDIEGIVDDALAIPGLSLIVETSGIGWKQGVFEALARRWPERLHWVVSLDADSPELYAKLRGQGYEEATGAARRLIELFPSTAYVQMVRSLDNEAALEEFWRGWKKLTENVIVQKYSTFAGALPPKKVTDLSPLVRRPCWHLKRDLSVLLDGTVPLCRDSVRGGPVLGSLFDASADGEAGPSAETLARRLAAVWAAGDGYHRRHVAEDWPDPCKACDEYYTYNA